MLKLISFKTFSLLYTSLERKLLDPMFGSGEGGKQNLATSNNILLALLYTQGTLQPVVVPWGNQGDMSLSFPKVGKNCKGEYVSRASVTTVSSIERVTFCILLHMQGVLG